MFRPTDLRKLWKRVLKPQIKEYFPGKRNEKTLEKYELEKFWPEEWCKES